jgi:L-histidine Nalpha-methyltransferase / hercynylcysteine S-oxide synthase
MESNEKTQASKDTEQTSMPTIIDIRSDAAKLELKQGIREGLRASDGEGRTLPTLLLYDEAGLKLFEKITYLPEYYLTGAEIEVLERHAPRIAERIPNDSIVVELGSGYEKKIFAKRLDRSGKRWLTKATEICARSRYYWMHLRTLRRKSATMP